MRQGKRLILITGGARSGKSDFAEELAGELGERILFVATAEAGDEEMRQRIMAHRLARPRHWRTIEAPYAVGRTLVDQAGDAEVVLLDCLTMLTTNLLLAESGDDPYAGGAYERIRARLQAELASLYEWFESGAAHLVVVSNEVGLGLVPPYPLGRAYRDLLGWANRWLATRADEVYLLVAGLPVEVKELARRVQAQRPRGRELVSGEER